jgi:hypothetical protein
MSSPAAMRPACALIQVELIDTNIPAGSPIAASAVPSAAKPLVHAAPVPEFWRHISPRRTCAHLPRYRVSEMNGCFSLFLRLFVYIVMVDDFFSFHAPSFTFFLVHAF